MSASQQVQTSSTAEKSAVTVKQAAHSSPSSSLQELLLHMHRQFKIPVTNSEDFVEMYGNLRDHCLKEGIWPFQIPLQKSSPTNVSILGHDCVVISSYNYLGLSGDKRVREYASKNADSFAESHGARVLSGTTMLHEKLESEIARVFNKEAALVFSSTYVANISTIPALASSEDFILIDWLAHKSLLDGCTISGATVLRFKHNDVAHAKHLYETKILPKRKPTTKVVMITDSVFSMDGDIFDLPSFSPFCKKNNIMLVMDECHGVGVIGETGKGIEEHYGMPNSVDVYIGTFSKGLGCGASFVASTKKLITYLHWFGRANVFSGALTNYQVLSAIKTLELFEQEKFRVQRCQENGRFLREKLQEAGFDIGLSETCIVPVIIGLEKKAYELFKYMYQRGFYVSTVTVPAVALGKSRIRCCALAQHSKEQLESFVKVLKQFFQEYRDEEYDYSSLEISSKL